MLLRVRALAAVSEQARGDFALDERLKKEGGGEEEEREKQTVAPSPGSHRASARRRRRRRPEDCHLKPGLRFEASQICAGKSAAAAQLVKTPLLMEQQSGRNCGGSTLKRCGSIYVNSACDGLHRPQRILMRLITRSGGYQP